LVFVVCRIVLLLKTKDKLGSYGNLMLGCVVRPTRVAHKFIIIIQISRVAGGTEFLPAVSVARHGGDAIHGLRLGFVFIVDAGFSVRHRKPAKGERPEGWWRRREVNPRPRKPAMARRPAKRGARDLCR
jgi:hypothetical protein